MPTRTIYLFDDLGNKVAVGTYEPAPVSLTVGGSWTNTQYTGSAPDPTGLTFTCTFSDGTSSSVVPTSVSPSTWSSTVGTQTATFSYTADGVTVTGSKSVSVESLPGHSIIFPSDVNLIYYRNGSDRTSSVTDIMAEIVIHYSNGSTSTHQLSGNKTTVNTMSSILGQTINNIVSVEFKNLYNPMTGYVEVYGTLNNLSEISHNGTIQSQTTSYYALYNPNGSEASVLFSVIEDTELSQIKVWSMLGGM